MELHRTVATDSVWNVSWLGCVGDIRCGNVAFILASPTGARHERLIRRWNPIHEFMIDFQSSGQLQRLVDSMSIMICISDR